MELQIAKIILQLGRGSVRGVSVELLVEIVLIYSWAGNKYSISCNQWLDYRFWKRNINI